MDMDVSLLWPSVTPDAHDHPVASAAHRAWRELAEHGATASSAFERERVADIMVVLEAMLVELALPCTAKDESARALAGALTRWRTSRDIAGAQADLGALLGRPVSLYGIASAPEAALMADCAGRLEDGLLPLLRHIEDLASTVDQEYQRQAVQAITEVTATAAEGWEAFPFEGPEAAAITHSWMLGPVSAAYACVLMARDAAPALCDGDKRAATVAKRWAYSRVRTDTMALLTSRHVGKTSRLIAGQAL